MINFLKLIRLPNLIIIAFVQILMRYGIMLPVLQAKGYSLQMSGLDFSLLLLSTILLAAAGYVINDYFDRKGDMINDPSNVIVEKKLSRRFAMWMHIILNFFGVIIGIYLTVKIGNYKYGVLYLFIPAVLWYYSTFFKNKLIIGNLIIASFMALIPLMVPLIELPLIKANYSEGLRVMLYTFDELLEWIIAFSVFSFMMIFIFNSTKEIINIDGDRECSRKTIPIIFGVKTAKVTIIILSVLTLLLSSVFLILNMFNAVTIVYYLVFILTPFILFLFAITRITEGSDTSKLNLYPKIIMLFGLLYTLVVYYIFNF